MTTRSDVPPPFADIGLRAAAVVAKEQMDEAYLNAPSVPDSFNQARKDLRLALATGRGLEGAARVAKQEMDAADFEVDDIREWDDARARLEAALQGVASSPIPAAPSSTPEFGDYVRTPEGRVGVMHGSGGMGSDRVSVEGVGYYDRDQLSVAQAAGYRIEQKEANGVWAAIPNTPVFDTRADAYDSMMARGMMQDVSGMGGQDDVRVAPVFNEPPRPDKVDYGGEIARAKLERTGFLDFRYDGAYISYKITHIGDNPVVERTIDGARETIIGATPETPFTSLEEARSWAVDDSKRFVRSRAGGASGVISGLDAQRASTAAGAGANISAGVQEVQDGQPRQTGRDDAESDSGVDANRRRVESTEAGVPEEMSPQDVEETAPSGDVGLRAGVGSQGDSGASRVPDGIGGIRSAGVEPSDPIGNPRLGSGLDTPQLPTPAPAAQGRDIILTSDDFAIRNPAARFDANLEALRTLKKIEEESRTATPEEQEVIARFSGWGDSAFNDAFPITRGYSSDKEGIWQRRGDALRDLVGEDEYTSIEKSRINAFFTTPTVIRAMWGALEQMGANNIANPRILEPSAGSGRFLGLQPVDMAARSQRIAVELDTTSARMLKQTYPNATVYGMGFEEAPIQNDSIDIAISNVPFGAIKVADPEFAKGSRRLFTTSIHNYFFGKTFDKLRPGGVLAFVTTHGTLDAPTSKPIREALAERGDFIGAVRLPNNAFPDTKVVTDIVFMRKRMPDEAPSGDMSWLDTATVSLNATKKEPIYSRWGDTKYKDVTYEVEKDINRYFIEHPEMVLGKQSAMGSMRGEDEYTVESDGRDLTAALAESVARLPRDIITDRPQMDTTLRTAPNVNPMNITEGAFLIGEDGKLYAKHEGQVVESQASPENQERIRAMLAIRDDARGVLNLQLENASDEAIAKAQANLNANYDAFATKYGPINNRDNRELIRRDPDGPFLRAIETPLALTKEWHRVKTVAPEDLSKLKMPIFSGRTIKGKLEGSATTATDAMLVSLSESGRLDFNRMGDLLNREPNDVRQELADERLIFKNPVGDWESADEYLSGNVRGKLRTAEKAASADPTYQVNVEALQAVQPADIPPSQITVKLGSPWVPASDVNDFVEDLLGTTEHRRRRYGQPERQGSPELFKYVPELGEWTFGPRASSMSTDPAKNAEWGVVTDKHDVPASLIIMKMLNSKPIELKMAGKEKGDKDVQDVAATAAAQAKAEAIQKEFERWLWSDPERSRRLSSYYNDHFNNLRPRRFDGKHLTFPGMGEKWAKGMRPHQKDAVWRVVQDGTTLLAHDVGTGKTGVMVASAMELRRLGLSRKNMFVVPNATHGQMVADFKEIYPYAKLLVPEDDDFTPARRSEFIARAATGDWDAVILAETQFLRIPVKPETEAAFLREEIAEIRAALTAQDDERTIQTAKEREKSHKELQTALAEAEARMKILQDKIEARRTDRALYFEDLGIDQLYVDEADRYKNLRYVSRMGSVKGLPNPKGSQRAWDMYQKVRYLQQKGGGRGVVFATGTPVANTIAELWTQMRYLQRPMLEERGLQHFDAWAKTFGATTNTVEQTAQGTFRPATRFARFVNVPELSNLWQAAADIRVVSEMPEIAMIRPQLVDEQGLEKRTVVAVPMDAAQKAWMAGLPARVDAMDPRDRKTDNMLKLSVEARLASLDLRMVDARAPENPNGKIAVAAAKIAQVHRETTPDKGTQLVFLDVGTPKADSDKEEPPEEGEGEQLDARESQVMKDVYAKMKRELVRAGVPAEEIAFAQDADSREQKRALYGKVNDGVIRVLIGSTEKMGAGVNVQKRAAALHHMDAPWRPRDIEQREGRILRQGNKVYGPKFDAEGKVTDPGKGVRIYTYVTEGSFDAFMWQAIESKAIPIKTIMKREPGTRTVEDVDSFVLSASEAKAIATGNPDILRRVQLTNALGKLQLLKATHQDEQIRAKEQLKILPDRIAALRRQVAELEEDAGKAKAGDESFGMTVGSQVFSDRGEAGEAIRAAVMAWEKTRTPGSSSAQSPVIGVYKGFTLHPFIGGNGWVILLRRPGLKDDYQTTAMNMESVKGGAVVTRIENVLARLPGQLADTKTQLRSVENSEFTLQKIAAKPFEQQERYAKVSAELGRLEKKLLGEDVEPEAGFALDEETVIHAADIPSAPAPLSATVERELNEIVEGKNDQEIQRQDEAAAKYPVEVQLSALRPFIGRSEEAALRENLRGEEGEFFREKVAEIAQRIDAMPATYEQEGKGDAAVVYLHYFKNGMDWYITEKDKGAPDDEPGTSQRQAFGLADLFGDGGELGYIDIEEIKNVGAELDLYWTPKTLAEVKVERDRATGRTSQIAQATVIEPKESPMARAEEYEIVRGNESTGKTVRLEPSQMPSVLRTLQEGDPEYKEYALRPVKGSAPTAATAAPAAIPAEMKAGPGEERVVASVYNEAGELQRRMTVKPDVALKIPVGPGEHVTATAKTADGENVDQKRGVRGSRLKLAVTEGQIKGLHRSGKLMETVADKLEAFRASEKRFLEERRGGIERRRKVRLD